MNIPPAYHNKHHITPFNTTGWKFHHTHIPPKNPWPMAPFLWAFKFSVCKHAPWFHCCVSKVTPSFQMLNFMYALDYNAYSHFQRTRGSQKNTHKIIHSKYSTTLQFVSNVTPAGSRNSNHRGKASDSLERCCQRHNFPNLTGSQEYVTKSTYSPSQPMKFRKWL